MNVLALTINKAGYHPTPYHLQLLQSVWHFLTSDHETWDSQLTFYRMTGLGPPYPGTIQNELSSTASFLFHNHLVIRVLERGKLRPRGSNNLYRV